MIFMLHVLLIFVILFAIIIWLEDVETASSMGFASTILLSVVMIWAFNCAPKVVKSSEELQDITFHQQKDARYYYVDSERNKVILDKVELITEGKSSVTINRLTQKNWYLDQMAVDTQETIAKINLKDVR